MPDLFNVEVRQTRGKHNARRLRKAGSIPAVLYGHGQENVCLVVPAEQFEAAVRHGSRLVSLTGAVNESAFIRELQWDTWGTHVLHVDFTRVSEHEAVQVQTAVELRGEAPGLKEGGLLEQLIHGVELECPASAIPEKLDLSVNNLKLGQSITVAELELPQGARVLADPEAVVVHCVVPAKVPEEEVAEAVPGEPELIGAKEEEKETEKN